MKSIIVNVFVSLVINLLSCIPIYSLNNHLTQDSDKTINRSQKINYVLVNKPIYYQDKQIIITEKYQKEIAEKIPDLDQEIIRLHQSFSIPLNQEIGLVYFHQGQENWTIKLTYGGFVINTSDKTIYTTEEIFTLKRIFETMTTINLDGKTYQTTGSMRQMGPMLHDKYLDKNK